MAVEFKVGVIDSGCAPTQALVAARRFWLDEGVLCEGELHPDRLGHGSAVLASLQAEAGALPLVLAQVFSEHGSTSALQVAAALFWLAEQGVTLINLSLGLPQDRAVLRQACAEVQQAGVLLCASSPAQGSAVYPAAYPGLSASLAMPVARRGSGRGSAVPRPTSVAMWASAGRPVPALAVRR